MKAEFSKNLVLLRKENGFSQKKVAADLQVSQALLSHYEKGIRECGLEFVIRAADYFGVSSDFLLGRSNHRNPPKPGKASAETGKSGEEKAILQSVSIVFGILEKINSKSLGKEVIHYLCAAVYTMLRLIGSRKNGAELFSLDSHLYSAMAASKMTMAKARCRIVIDEEKLEDRLPLMTAESLNREYPAQATGVQQLIQMVEQQKAD